MACAPALGYLVFMPETLNGGAKKVQSLSIMEEDEDRPDNEGGAVVV
jgi:hypothetical protein